jgi:hypothetical protein
MPKQPTRNRSENPQSEETAAPQFSGDTTAATIDRERVAMRAYELYIARGGGEGRELDDWLSAERELTGTAPGRDDS